MSDAQHDDYMSDPTGSPSAQEPLPPAGPMLPSGSGTPPPVRSGDVSDDDRLLAALSWLSLAIFQIPLVSVVLLLAEANKNRPFQRYHAINSIGFWAAAVVYEVLATIVYSVVGALTLGCGLVCLFPIFFIPHIIALYYAYESYMGRRPVIPVVSEFMNGQGWV